MPPRFGRLAWLAAYGVAMAYVESATIVYLRALYHPDGFRFPLVLSDPRMVTIEGGREAATLVMLLAVAMVMGRDRWQRFLFFAFGLGVWDIFYYVWLRVFLGWPPSLLTRDLLFMLPVPWIAPVLAPLIVSVGLIVGSVLLLERQHRDQRLHVPGLPWGLAVTGGALVLLSFMLDFRAVLDRAPLPPFRWGLFVTGIVCATSGLALALRHLDRKPDEER